MVRKFCAYLFGVVSTYLLAVIFVSQLNISRVTEMGYSVGFLERVQTLLQDWVGMLSVYLPLIAVALLIAWLFTGLLLTRWLPRTLFLYVLAGFVALMALHPIMQAVFTITAVAPTRTLAGLLTQGLAGAFGGYCFYRVAFMVSVR